MIVTVTGPVTIVPDAGDCVNVTGEPVQLSVAVILGKKSGSTFVQPVEKLYEVFPGQVMVGAILSTTVTVVMHVPNTSPHPDESVKVTGVLPILYTPLAFAVPPLKLFVMTTEEQPPITAGFGTVAFAEQDTPAAVNVKAASVQLAAVFCITVRSFEFNVHVAFDT